jgi:chromosome segregation ATPase
MKFLLAILPILFLSCSSGADGKKLEKRIETLEIEMNRLRGEISEAKGEVSNAVGRVKALEKNYEILYREVENLKKQKR